MPAKKSRANQALGKAIRSARVRRGESQEGFSRREDVPIDRSYFGAVERGEFNVTLDTIVTVAHGLNLTVAELLKQAGL
jgi:transcriptional regulator with XRE-family HTH domain